MPHEVPEDVYEGELIRYPGPWAFRVPHAGIILVADQELIDLAEDPDRVLNLATGFQPREQSLRQVCEAAQQRGVQTLKVAFDYFFRQYRPGMDTPRTLTPDMDEYVRLVAQVGSFAANYGLRLELSLLSPLEIGPAYVQVTGEYGRWMHYRKGLRDPKTGAFSVQLWQQRRWVNNKGPVDIEPDGVRVFAFREHPVPGTPYRVVEPDALVEISDCAQTQMFENVRTGVARRARIYGEGETEVGRLNRVLVVQQYRCPEMDYFSETALPYLTDLVDKYIDAGVQLGGFYSDEMHIQQDWGYFSHHDHGQFALRYVSRGLEQQFAATYGEEYVDLAKYLIYFTYAQEDFASNLNATEPVMHVFGRTPEAIHATALFRSRYYALLQNGVVDLFLEAKEHAEKRVGYRLETRAHATWAESPTIDYWRTRSVNRNARKYEYTSDFVWSNTVHQAASACHDYFKWGEYLTGTGNDHPEGGWLDRSYYALALACSTGIVNPVPYSYCAHWGHPAEVSWRRHQLQNAFGVGGSHDLFAAVQGMQHRDVDVLMLYPLDLVSAEERFGSWTTQYGYANTITQAKLLEMGSVRNGAVELAGRRFTSLIATFEPFPQPALFDLMETLAASGGNVVWTGPPPLLDGTGAAVRERWQRLFGVDYPLDAGGWGRPMPGHAITFRGALASVAPQIVLTDLLVDHVYPVSVREGTQPVAHCGRHVVGTLRAASEGGQCIFLGYRPRDDPSASLGYETRNWFEVLQAIGAYPTALDHTEVISRQTDYLACRFPNGAISLAPHLTRLEEDWPGGFSRNREEDAQIERRLDLPSREIRLREFRVQGYEVDYEGIGAMAFRMDTEGDLVAFAGHGCSHIRINSREHLFADRPVGQIGWAPVPKDRQVPGGAWVMAFCSEPATLRLPAVLAHQPLHFFAQGDRPGSKGIRMSSRREADALQIEVDSRASGRWLYGVPVVY